MPDNNNEDGEKVRQPGVFGLGLNLVISPVRPRAYFCFDSSGDVKLETEEK